MIKDYLGKNNMEVILEEKDQRIIPIKGSFTTTPYKILDTFCYYE